MHFDHQTFVFFYEYDHNPLEKKTFVLDVQLHRMCLFLYKLPFYTYLLLNQTSCNECWMPLLVWSVVHTSSIAACHDSYTSNYIGSMYRSRSHSSSASWCSTVRTTKHLSTSSTSASLSPASPPDNIFALPAKVFLSCLAIVSAVMVGGLFLWPALRNGTGYQTVWEIRPSAETPSSVHLRRFYCSLLVYIAHWSFWDDALYKFTYLLTYDQSFTLREKGFSTFCYCDLDLTFTLKVKVKDLDLDP